MTTVPKILVIGDAMKDLYHVGTAVRLSPEAPIPVVKITETKHSPGGAANVAANLASLGAEALLLHGWRVWANGKEIPQKHRLVVGTTQLARWDEWDSVSPIPVEALQAAVERWQPDGIVVSDYGKGSVDGKVSRWVIDQNLPTFVDTKHGPEHFAYDHPQGFTSRWVYFPNRQEYEKDRVRYDLCPSVVLKKSEEGVEEREYGKPIIEYPTFARSVGSVCGAGDVVVAAYAFAVTSGRHNPLWFANLAAGLAVEKPGTSVVSLREIEERMKELGA